MCVCVMKTAMTNFDIAAILPELRKHTIGGRIDNVYQITQEAFLLKIHPDNLNLVIEPAKRVHLTKFEIRTPAKPSQLCMAFRKHIRSAKIVGIEQPHFERVLLFEVERQGERQKIVVELLPRGNLILVDHDGRVVVSSRYARMKDRSILRGQPLKLPPPRGKNLLEATREDVEELRSLKDLDSVKAFAHIFGVGGIFAEEVLQRADIDRSKPAVDLSDDQIERVFRAISELKDALLTGAQSPAVVLDDSQIIDVVPFELERYEGMRKTSFATFSEAVDEYFTILSSSGVAGRRERALMEKRQQLERRLEAQKTQLDEFTSSIKTLRTMGDLVFRHLGEIQPVLEAVAQSRRSKQSLEATKRLLMRNNADGSRIYPSFLELGPRGDKVTFAFEDTRIEAEVRKRPQDQAAEYYEKAKHLESKLSGLKKSTQETELLLGKLTSEEIELKQTGKPEPRQEKEWFEKFRWFYSSEGMLAIGGRDAASNETLLKRYVNPEDLVMHAEVHGAPFFVIKTNGAQPSNETLMEAAQACVSYSRLWKEGIRAGDAYWVRPEQVTKSAPAGEYLTKGAFMIRGTRNFLRGVELTLALGVTLHEGKPLLMAGPLSAVRNKCSIYVEMRQGRTSPAEAARRILAMLRTKAEGGTHIDLPRNILDDVIRLLPPGGVEVVKSP